MTASFHCMAFLGEDFYWIKSPTTIS